MIVLLIILLVAPGLTLLVGAVVYLAFGSGSDKADDRK